MKYKYLIGFLISLFIFGFMGGTFCLKQKSIPPFHLNKEKVIIEYGKTYEPTFNDLVKIKGLNQKEIQYLKEHVKIKNHIKNENLKSYPAVGHYQMILEYRTEKKNVEIIVQDTVKPVLKMKKPIEIETDTELSCIDFSQYITVDDLSTVKELQIDDHLVNTHCPGQYTIRASIEDIYKNRGEKELMMTVLPKKQAKQSHDESTSAIKSQETQKSTPAQAIPNKETISTPNDTVSDVSKDNPWLITWWAKCKDCGAYVEEIKDRKQGWQEESVKQKLLNSGDCVQNSYTDQNGVYCPGKHTIRWGANHLPEDW